MQEARGRSPRNDLAGIRVLDAGGIPPENLWERPAGYRAHTLAVFLTHNPRPGPAPGAATRNS